MSWPAYPDYTNSETAWLGSVPSHWTIAPVKRFLRSLDHIRIPLSTTERGTRQGEYPYYGASGVVDHVDSYLFDASNVLVSEDGANLLARRTPIAFVARGKYWVNNHAHILEPLDSDEPDFWAHRIESEKVAPFVTGAAQPKLTIEALMNLSISAPPTIEERRSIVRFLDRETAKTDALITKQEQLIAAVREDRTATITHAVTKGLNPDVTMKETGAESLAAIPENWSWRRLKFMLSGPLTYGANAPADDDTPDNPRYVRITDIAPDGSLRPETFRSLPLDVAAPYLLTEGDILFARSGATVGKTFMYQRSWGRCCYAGYLVKATVDRSITTPEYVNYYTATAPYWHHIFSAQIQATIQNVSAERFGNLPVPLPPLPNQREIVKFLDTQCIEFDRLIAKANQVIATLREYRSALITDAVTGKIDVRGAA
ncbi:restriction endonuclease subunit S [Mycolicibacter minnesotensis]